MSDPIVWSVLERRSATAATKPYRNRVYIAGYIGIMEKNMETTMVQQGIYG